MGCAFRFQDVFDNRHPNYAGDVGIGINPKLAQRIKEADLVLAIGPRLGEMTTGGYTLLEAPRPRQRLVHVHAGAEELGRVYQPHHVDAVLDGRDGSALEGVDPPTPRSPAAGGAGARRLRRQLDAALPSCRSTWPRWSRPSSGWRRRTRATNGAGNYSGWLHRFYRYPGLQHGGRTQLAPTSGAMGYGFPAAVSAACCFRRTVIASPATATS